MSVLKTPVVAALALSSLSVLAQAVPFDTQRELFRLNASDRLVINRGASAVGGDFNYLV